MWRSVVLSLGLGSLAVTLVLLANSVPAQPPADRAAPPASAKVDKEGVPENPMAGAKIATSRVSAVTVYPNSALVTREVEGLGRRARSIADWRTTPRPRQTRSA